MRTLNADDHARVSAAITAAETHSREELVLVRSETPAVALPADNPAVIAGEIDVVRRRSSAGSWLFAINHSAEQLVLPARAGSGCAASRMT